MTDVEVQVDHSRGIALVALIGELDVSGTTGVEDALRSVEASKPPAIVLDLRNLSFIDSSGLKLILEADMRAQREGRQLALVRGPDDVHRVFQMGLLDERLHFVDDASEVSGGSSTRADGST